MQPSSSIFSFDTLRGWPRPGRAFWLTLALCAGFRVLLGLNAERLDDIPAPSMYMRYEYLERVHVRRDQPHPKILIMGNSLSRYGLLEDQIARAANLPEEEVLNLAVASGRPWEAMLFLRRNPELARDVELVIYNVGRHQIERNVATKHMGRFYRYATLGEKLTADGWNHRAKLLLDVAWPYETQRRRLATWVAGLAGMDNFGFDRENPRPAWEPDYMPIWEEHQDKYARAPAPESFNGDHALSPLHTRLLDDFIAYWQQRDVPLILIQTPVKHAWIDAAFSHEATRHVRLAFEERIKSRTGPGVAYIPWYTAEQCGVDDPRDFLDYSHLRPEGARKLTATLTDALRERRWLPLPKTDPKTQLAKAKPPQ